MRNAKKLLLALGLLLGAGLCLAEVSGNKGISVTSTSATTTLSTAVTDLTLINDSTSANELYARVFRCGETSAAATTSSPIRLEPGESVSFTHNPRSETGIGYCAFSYVCDTAETATLRYIAK